MTRDLTILKAGAAPTNVQGEVVDFQDVKRWFRGTAWLRHVLRYRRVRLQTTVLELLPKPFLSAILIRGLSRGRCWFEDDGGARLVIGVGAIARLGAGGIRDVRTRRAMLRDLDLRLAAVTRAAPVRSRLQLAGRPLYLRTDLVFGLTSGGSVGHIAGVLNNLDAFGGHPIFATTDRIPGVRPDIETWVVRPDGRYRDFTDLPQFAFNIQGVARVVADLKRVLPSFVYQRYSYGNFIGAQVASSLATPFVLEYNGSEVWIRRNWSVGNAGYIELAERIEEANLVAADVVVVVSDAMQEELVGRGVDPAKILVNPNGVDVDRYRPDVDGSEVRRRLGLDGYTVIGFIGTFGPWHGAEVLAEAFARLLRRDPTYSSRLRLLLIGDGDRYAATRDAITAGGVAAEAVFAGRTTQLEGPSYLAACDILASPHVPNADGSRFFGSPTKLFEYMAMGRGIVASDLEQIGQVLEHDRTAWLVQPGDPEALADGLQALVEDSERRDRLGRAAREDAVQRHTWLAHTKYIIDALERRLA